MSSFHRLWLIWILAACLSLVACGPQMQSGQNVVEQGSTGNQGANPGNGGPGNGNRGNGTKPRPSGAGDITVCPKGRLPGTDVSNYDPGTDWHRMYSGGMAFAFIKATEGTTYQNPYFTSDWQQAQKAGVLRGAYHYFHPNSDPVKAAQFYLQVVGKWGQYDLPPMLDMEETDGINSSAQIENALTWLKIVESASGKIPIIYVSPNFFDVYLKDSPVFNQYGLFIADTNKISCPPIPPPWSNWVFWQYGVGPVPGVVGNGGDLDTFNGNWSDLTQYAATGSF